jgi:hypothetical protein
VFNEVAQTDEWVAIVFRKFEYFLSINDEARKNHEIRMTNTPERGNSGTFLDCGGKRSATPLFFAQLRGSSGINWRSMRGGSHRRGKSAVVATLCRRSPKCAC